MSRARPERQTGPGVLTWCKVPFTLQAVQTVGRRQQLRTRPPALHPLPSPFIRQAPPLSPASWAHTVPTLITNGSLCRSWGGGHSLHCWRGQQAPSSWVRTGRVPSGQAGSAGQWLELQTARGEEAQTRSAVPRGLHGADCPGGGGGLSRGRWPPQGMASAQPGQGSPTLPGHLLGSPMRPQQGRALPVLPGFPPDASGHAELVPGPSADLRMAAAPHLSPGLTAGILGAALAGLGGLGHRHESGLGADGGRRAGLAPAAHGPGAGLAGALLAVRADRVAGLQGCGEVDVSSSLRPLPGQRRPEAGRGDPEGGALRVRGA